MGKKSSSAPKAPDFTAAAKQQGKDAKDVINSQTWANRPDQSTPWANVSWEAQKIKDPVTGKDVTQWNQKYELNPELQAALDSQMQIQKGRSSAAAGLMDQVSQSYSRPFDWGSMPARGQNVNLSGFERLGDAPRLAQYTKESPTLLREVATENAQRVGAGPRLDSRMRPMDYQDRMNLGDNGALQATDDAARQRIEQGLFDRMAPIHERQQSALSVKLANQGITPGSVAYKRAMQDLGDQQSREKYDAMQTAGQEIQRNQQMALGNRQQLTSEDVADASLFNAANQQAFNQLLASKQFGNQSLQQMYNNQLSGAGLNNAAIQQDYNQRLGSTGFFNQAGMNQQSTDLQKLGFNNSAMAQQQGLDLAKAAFNNAVAKDEFAQGMQQSQYQNLLRQQAIAEALQARNMPLNDLNMLMSGQQVGMQQLPNFNAAGAAQPVQYLPAAGMQYQAALDASNAQNMGQNSMMNGMGNIFGSVLSAYASNPSAFSFSDKGLKKILGKVGKIGEFNLYRFKYLGSNAEEVGVIAQEVEKVRPDLVMRHPNGYLMVNYEGLEA